MSNQNISTSYSQPSLRALCSMVMLGIASGTPIAVLSSTMLAFLKEGGGSLVFMSSLFLWKFPYSVKFLWAPLLDRYTGPLGFLGRRKGWLWILSILLALILVVAPTRIGSQDYTGWLLFVCAVSFFGASFDIVVDAYRRDVFSLDQYGKATATFVIGYRLGALFAGGIAIGLAEFFSWSTVFAAIGAVSVVGALGLIFGPREPALTAQDRQLTLTQSFIHPIQELCALKGIGLIVVFLLLYKIGDSLIEALLTPFLMEIGYKKIDIAFAAKTFGLGAGLFGGVCGGFLLERCSLRKGLIYCGVLQLVANSGFIYLAHSDPSFELLAAVNVFEKLAAGMSGTVLAAFLGSLCSVRFSATQYAILTSLLGIPRDIVSSTAGYFVQHLGWSWFFLMSMIVASPAVVILFTAKFKQLLEERTKKA